MVTNLFLVSHTGKLRIMKFAQQFSSLKHARQDSHYSLLLYNQYQSCNSCLKLVLSYEHIINIIVFGKWYVVTIENKRTVFIDTMKLGRDPIKQIGSPCAIIVIMIVIQSNSSNCKSSTLCLKA